jgi:hypothetical protein
MTIAAEDKQRHSRRGQVPAGNGDAGLVGHDDELGPVTAGAMTCHYLDAAVGMVACAWLLNKILRPAR